MVDLCAGKGFLAMCLAHGVLGSDTRIQRVVMLEKARVNWAHLRADSLHSGPSTCTADSSAHVLEAESAHPDRSR